MVKFDEENDRFKKITLIKWKEALPNINEEQAMHCEKEFFKFINKDKSESEALKTINEYLVSQGLVPKVS